MRPIMFAELRDCVDVNTKEERVPTVKTLMERGTHPVIHGRFGKFGVLRIMTEDRAMFSDEREGFFEDVTIYPGKEGKSLAGYDMSAMTREILVRHGNENVYGVNMEDTPAGVYVDGIHMPDGMWLPEIQAAAWRAEDFIRNRKLREDNEGREDSGEREMRHRMRKNLIEVMDQVSEITVFEDGSVVYYAGGRHCVFPLCKCRDYSYLSVTKTICMDRKYMDNVPWNIRLTLMGEDRNSKNVCNKKNEVPWNYDFEEMMFIEAVVKEYSRRTAQQDLVGELMPFLNEKESEVIRLRYFEDMKNQAIADRMNCSKKTVSRNAVSGLEHLRRVYDRMYGCGRRA